MEQHEHVQSGGTLEELAAKTDAVGSIILIGRDRIRTSVKQPRKHFSLARLHDLAKSIAEIGQKTPVVVRPVCGDPCHEWELVDGERRFRACGAAHQGGL